MTTNALKVLDVAGRADIPVAAGAERALLHPARTADEVHGATGLDGPDLPEPSRAAQSRSTPSSCWRRSFASAR